MKWTAEQQQVIASRNPEVLVSAAAGSGKTAVLAQRVADMVLNDGLVMEQLLVLTFTRASAADMKTKIEQQLLRMAADDSLTYDQRVRCTDEARHLALAQISTIDSYCSKIVREFFALVPIDPTFGICEQDDEERLLNEAVEETLNTFYEHAQENQQHALFVTAYPTEQVEGMLLTLFAFLMARPQPEKWLDEHCRESTFDPQDENHPLSRFLTGRYESMLVMAEEKLNQLAALLNDPRCPPEYEKIVQADDEALDLLRRCVGKSPAVWAEAAKSISWMTMPKITVKKQPEGFAAFKDELFMPCRNKLKEVRTGINKAAPTPESVLDLYYVSTHLPALADLCRLLLENNRKVKRQANLFTFADIAQAAYTLTLDESVITRLRESARAIFVDEYQDVSPLQEALLQRIKNEQSTLFYVGDVKQSIYRFRNAKPMNFLEKLNTFSTEENAEKRSITLNRNFRSAPSVLDAANRVMRVLMRPDVNELSYHQDAWLYQGTSLPDSARTELHLIPTENLSGSKNDAAFAEVYSVVQTIMRLHETELVYTEDEPRKARYSDFAILIPRNALSEPLQKMLELFRIQCENDQSVSLYERTEIRDLIEFLILMDSPADDEALFCVLRSWLFGFTSAEIAELRVHHPEGSLWQAAEAAAESLPNEPLRMRLREALTFLSEERFRIHNCNLFLYLWDFVRRSGLYDQVQNLPDGFTARAALDQIIFEAISFEEEHFQGIYAFTERLRRRAEHQRITPLPQSADLPDGVHVMTIHKSKGLQFPFVIVMGLGKSLRGAVDTSPIRLHDSLGAALHYINPIARVRRDTLLWSAINQKTADEDRAESVRLLYVAMTRASQQTLLFGSLNTVPELNDLLPEKERPESVRLCSESTSFLHWLLYCVKPYDEVIYLQQENEDVPKLIGDPIGDDRPWRVIVHERPIAINPYEQEDEAENEPEATTTERTPAGPNPLRLAPFEYEQRLSEFLPKREYAQLPRSVTPSQVNAAMRSGLTLPTGDDDILNLKRIPAFEPKSAEELPLPEFRDPCFDFDVSEEAKSTARGTATHILLQLCDFSELRTTLPTLPAMMNVLRRQWDGMLRDERINQTDYENADLRMAARFLVHPLGQAALKSQTCYREKAFFSYFLPPLKSILLRGSIDLCYYDEGDAEHGIESGWVVLDYKTDRVDSLQELLSRYRVQLGCYRRAVEEATHQRVKTCALFSLRLGHAVVLPPDEDVSRETILPE